MSTKFIIFASLAVFALAGGTVMAAPFNASGNPNIVANYPTGPHGVIPEPELHEGADVVMAAGQSGNFQQWFYGTSASEGLHGEHSVWKESPTGTCPDNWTLVPEPYPEWGDYLTPGVDYCVHTNNFHPSN